ARPGVRRNPGDSWAFEDNDLAFRRVRMVRFPSDGAPGGEAFGRHREILQPDDEPVLLPCEHGQANDRAETLEYGGLAAILLPAGAVFWPRETLRGRGPSPARRTRAGLARNPDD